MKILKDVHKENWYLALKRDSGDDNILHGPYMQLPEILDISSDDRFIYTNLWFPDKSTKGQVISNEYSDQLLIALKQVPCPMPAS